MQNLSLILTHVKELLILNNSSVKNFKNTDGVNLAKKVSNDNSSDAEDDLLEFDEEEINEPVDEIDVEEAKKDIISSIVSLLHSGGIDEEISSKIMEMLGGEFDEKSVEQLEDLINNSTASTTEKVVVKDKDGINEVLDSMDASLKSKILAQIDDAGSISSISCFEDGSYQIVTNDASFSAYPSGNFVSTYNNDAKTGVDNYNEDGKISNSTYINHAMNDSVVQENYTYKEDGGYTKTIDDSSNPSQQKIVEMSPDNEVMSVSTKNTQTGEIEQNYVSEKYYPSQSGGVDGNNKPGSESDPNIGDLEQERDEASKDLEENQNSYTETENEKNDELGSIDSEIGSGEGELSNANDELDGANSQVDDAASNADEAQSEVDASQNDVDNTQSELESAESQAQQAQGQEQVAAQDNQTKIQEQNNANQDYGTATGELNEAQGATNEAQGVADDTNSDLVEATGETSAAFNVLNQKQAEVDAAQQEYDSANAAENKEDESLWTKFKNWVSSLWDKLTDAITGRDEAAREAENKKNEEEKARAVDKEAQEALSERKEEQETAQDVANSAQVVLDRKTGEREVSDQEYADALLDLADAMSVKDDATGEYDSALEQYKEKYNYKVDADGNLVDAQGNQVSCAQVVQELEAFVQDLNYTRVNTETTYDSTLNATSAAISGDQAKIQELDTRITQLKQENARKEQELAMQEQMLSELAKQKGELNSSKDSAGIGDDIAAIFGGSYKGDEEQFKTKQEALEKALKSGNEKDIQAAYKAIYGDKEVVIDANGNIIDPSTLDEEELAKCTTSKISDLSTADLTNQMEIESTAAINASLLVDQINAGTFVANGKTVTMEQLNAALEKQADDLIKQMEDAASQQGIISKGIGAVNNLFGIGTSETEAKAQVGQYKAMVERLKTCKDPKEFAALYKSVTGNNFDATNMISLLAYDTIKNPDEAKGSEQKGEPAPELVDLTDCINDIKANVDEQADGNADVLLQTGNSRAAESIQDYIETQKTAKDAIIGVAEGIIAVAAVAAAPFTGGASLLLAAGVGAATGITLNAVDSIYDKNGDGTLEFNYSMQEALKDGLSGSLNGAIGVFSAGAGGAITKSIGSSAAKNMVTTTFNQSFKKAALNFGSKMAGAAAEGIIDGGVSSGGQYIIEAATNKDVEFSFSKLAEVTGQGAAFGAIFNVGLKGTGEILSGTSKYIKARGLEKEVNAILAQGGGDSSIAKMIAGKLDDGLMSGGKVNRYAVSQLMSNAEDSLKALKGMGFSENTAMSILNKTSLDSQASLPKVLEGLKLNSGIIHAGDEFTPESIMNFVENLDDVKLTKKGGLKSCSSTNADGTNLAFEFDAKGRITTSSVTYPDGSKVRLDYLSDGTVVRTNIAAPETASTQGSGNFSGLPDGDDVFRGADYTDATAKASADVDTSSSSTTNTNVDVDAPSSAASNVQQAPEPTYAQQRVAQAVNSRTDLSMEEWNNVIRDEYARIRETGAYAVNYDAINWEDPRSVVQNVINRGNIELTPSREGRYWMYRGNTDFNAVDRMSANVRASASMINELDEFCKTGVYIDASGNYVKIDNMTPFYYKTPLDVNQWTGRQDPLTFYFDGKVNSQTYDAIAQITGRHARGSVFNANPSKSWVSNVELNPPKASVDALIKDLEKYSRNLAKRLGDVFEEQGGQLSSAQFVSYQNILKYLKNAFSNYA